MLDTANPQPDNGYAYALNNPSTRADPSGLCVHADGLSCGATCGGTCGPPAPAPAPSFGSSNSAEHYNNGYTGNITLSFGSSNSAEHYSHGYTGELPPSKPKPAAKPRSGGCHGFCLGHALAKAAHATVHVVSSLNPVPAFVGCLHMISGSGGSGSDCVQTVFNVGILACTVASDGLCGVAEEADEGASAGERAAAACGGESFAADTNVVLADGSTKAIDQVKIGDKVEATDPTTGKTAAQTVTQVWVNHDTDLMDLTVQTGAKSSVIHATQHHLFWDATRHAWTEADRLTAGDQLRTDDGTFAAVTSTLVVTGAADMWDLTVTNNHDFYIVTATANILVHNCPTRFGNGGDRAPRSASARNTDVGSFKTRGQAWRAAQDDADNYKYATPREECSPTGCHVHLDVYNNQGELLETRHYTYQEP